METKAQTETSPKQEKPKRHLRNLLLDTRFQLRWVLRVVIATSIIMAVMGFFLYRTVGQATDQMLAQQLADPTLTTEGFEAFVKQSEYDKRVTLFTIVGSLVTLVLLLGGLTIVYTHKIAGPIYKMRKLFSTIDGKNLQMWAKLRNDDELQEAFIDFDNMLRRLRESRQDDISDLEKIRALVDKNEPSENLLESLDQLIARFDDSLKMDK